MGSSSSKKQEEENKRKYEEEEAEKALQLAKENALRIQEIERIARQNEERRLEELAVQMKQLELTESYEVIENDPQMIMNLLRAAGIEALDENIFETRLLPINSWEYVRIKEKFASTNKKCFKVDKIMKVHNPLLLLQFNLKKLNEACKSYNVQYLFHGTKLIYLESICTWNFNWRLRGSSTGHIFGQGVSFTPISNYATHYCDRSYEKVMIVAQVIVKKSCVGNKEMVVPLEGFDTSQKPDGNVVVKYDDNSFYPEYLIYYSGIDYKN